MLRPNRWTIGTIALALVLFLAIRPEARVPDRIDPAAVPIAPAIPFELEGCPAVQARVEYERTDCLQSARRDLLEGRIDLGQALSRLEACADERPDIAPLAERRARLQADAYRARLAFGEVLEPSEEDHYDGLLAQLDDARSTVPTAAVSRLAAAGITPAGLQADREQAILDRLTLDATLRHDFRSVFGDTRADDLEAIVTDADQPLSPGLVLGGTVVVPNRPAAQPTDSGTITIDPEGDAKPLVVSSDAYSIRVASDLIALEEGRTRYLTSAAAANHRVGSVRRFVSSLGRLGKPNVERELQAQVEHDKAALVAQLMNLERRLGVDPLLARTAGESVGLVTEINRGCIQVAQNRRRWIRTGAGVVTGLVGAAGVVVATGTTGTLLGGVTIAAAIEASLGAYLIARSERVHSGLALDADDEPTLPEDRRLRRFRPPNLASDQEEGSPGAAADDLDTWFEDVGEPEEASDLDGDGIDEEGDDSTEQRKRENTIPPVLPIDPPEQLRELPPLLDTPVLRALRELTLPEIQDRLDEFLALNREAEPLLDDGEPVEPPSNSQMISDAQAALHLWVTEKELAERFGSFFIQAELEGLAVSQQHAVLSRAMTRYSHDRDLYDDSRDVDELRRRFAARLVTHCRTGRQAGDLLLTACTDETALSIMLIAAIRDAGITVRDSAVLGIQAYNNRFEAVIFASDRNEVYSLTRGTAMEGIVAPIYHPASFYYNYLAAHGVAPDVDVDQHLLIALPDRPMPPELEREECVDEESRGFLGKAVEWIGSMIGVRRISSDDPCAPVGDAQSQGGGENDVGVDITLPTPPNPLSRGGGGQSGGSGGGGGGGGGGNPLTPPGSSDPLAGSSSGSPDGEPANAGGGSSQGTPGGAAASDGEAGGGSGGGENTGAPSDDDSRSPAEAGTAGESEQGGEAGSGSSAAEQGADAGSETAGSAGSGGFAIGNAELPEGTNLADIGRESVRMSEQYARAPRTRIAPWRLRDDEGMMTGSTTRVLYADNPRALERFDADDLFITLSPAEVEAQRRMLEADAYPIFQAEVDCDAPNLPPRRVLRRAATGDPGFRYLYCDQHESMVIFRDRSDADDYAALSAPDRPLFLARLASERLERFQRSPEVKHLHAFLEDPNSLRGLSRDDLYEIAKAAGDLLVFQNALESALVQSMNELGPSRVRSYYYDMHRQVLQAPFFIELAEAVYRLNQRLASDPLQALAWANAQPTLARQGFFDLYHRVGGMMEWPERWATLERRYGNGDAIPLAPDPDAPSLDFLQILSDPTRVQVDWDAERESDPSIRDRHMQDGAERTTEERDTPTTSDQLEREDEVEHQRGGTDGLGRAGDGESIGPESGRRPLQMIHIRLAPETGDPDRPRLPDSNLVRPGGTDGRRRTQTEESASRQEPMLWVSPETFIEAILSPWDGRDLEPASAERVPPILRFNQRLRERFLDDMHSAGVYHNRLRTAMEFFTRSGWLRYAEVREAMGGSLASVKAVDTGRFSGAYSGNAPINDQDQIRIPNFFTDSGIIIPADLFEPVREHYTESILGIFDLVSDSRVPDAAPLSSVAVRGDSAEGARTHILRSLELIRQQATPE